jgi:hypothetical protein
MSVAHQIQALFGASIADLLAPEALQDCSDYSVYVSGSLVEGLGNRCSDIDIFVVGRISPVHTSSENATGAAVHHLSHRRVDYQYWSEVTAHRLAEKLQTPAPETCVAFGAQEAEFIHRLRIGLPLTNPARFGQLQDAFDYSRFSRLLADRATEEVENALEDLYGMYDSNDIESALLRAREVVELAADVYRHRNGDTNPKPKWRARILSRLPQERLKEQVLAGFWRHQFPQDLRDQPSTARAYVRECIAYANMIVEWSQE